MSLVLVEEFVRSNPDISKVKEDLLIKINWSCEQKNSFFNSIESLLALWDPLDFSLEESDFKDTLNSCLKLYKISVGRYTNRFGLEKGINAVRNLDLESLSNIRGLVLTQVTEEKNHSDPLVKQLNTTDKILENEIQNIPKYKREKFPGKEGITSP